MGYYERTDEYLAKGMISDKVADLLKSFYRTYKEAIRDKGESFDSHEEKFNNFLDFAVRQVNDPYPFEPFHRRITEPFNYYDFGISFVAPLIKMDKTQIIGLENVDKMVEQIEKGDNVILFANHQIEPDPQAIASMLQATHPKFAEEMIFVAGHRVTTDALAVPLSLGCNLLCIYSKKYVENPPEQKEEKMIHNKRTMMKMSELLAEGGKCIYVAPSGGRDRPDAEGIVDVSPFDPASLEMFRLMAMQSGHPTHFYPLALRTYDILPPPDNVQSELGEYRNARYAPCFLCFNKELDLVNFPGSEGLDKKTLRQKRADYVWTIVRNDYLKLLNA
ncbi:MAG: 1-acyl-sn-glycerol-3-phosphate acyltransferase [Chlamydiales bacterium]|nr:1-acyl-sn-glycerol-3-phosphate acyltransferase [Chlamydiia bacterium]MCP5507037.1 1-acyl-sn-glycerol-3-phosphate acyltransferase [Chlamydiales bacterium]